MGDISRSLAVKIAPRSISSSFLSASAIAHTSVLYRRLVRLSSRYIDGNGKLPRFVCKEFESWAGNSHRGYRYKSLAQITGYLDR
jgi:hypothetical protein